MAQPEGSLQHVRDPVIDEREELIPVIPQLSPLRQTILLTQSRQERQASLLYPCAVASLREPES